MHQPFQLYPIGVLRTPFIHRESTPTQGVFAPKAAGTLEVFDEFAEGLQDIEGFSHLILLYMLHRTQKVDMRVLPFLDDSHHGILATRNPRRPNHVGLTVVQLAARSNNVLHLSGLDMLDGTPVIDIKPYVPRFDSFPDAAEGWFAGKDDRPKPPGRE